MLPDTAKVPPKVQRELDKLSHSRLLSEFARTSGVSRSTLENAKRGKPISAETLQHILQGMAERQHTFTPSVGVEMPPALAGIPSEALARARLHAGIVHIVAQLSDLLQLTHTQERRITQLTSELEALQAQHAEAKVMLLTHGLAAPAERMNPTASLVAVAEVAGPQHADLMRELSSRLPQVVPVPA